MSSILILCKFFFFLISSSTYAQYVLSVTVFFPSSPGLVLVSGLVYQVTYAPR